VVDLTPEEWDGPVGDGEARFGVRTKADACSDAPAGLLYAAFAPEEARRILLKLEFRHTHPSTAVWLNMAEIEFSVLSRQCAPSHAAAHAQIVRDIFLDGREPHA
jgi:hypothetical protein